MEKINSKHSTLKSSEFPPEFSDNEQSETESCSIKEPLNNLDLIKKISDTLNSIIIDNKNSPKYKSFLKKSKNSVFSKNNRIPSISLYDYLIRIQTYSFLEKNTLITSLIYVDRLCEIGKQNLTDYNIHRIIFTGMLLAIKYNEDCIYSNDYYAKIAGIKNKELYILEKEFLELIDFKLFVDENIFNAYAKYLENKEEKKDD